MNVLVLHNVPGEDASADEQDILIQRDAVLTAVQDLGHKSAALGCTLDLERLRRKLLDRQPDVVFNLVESLGGTDRLMALVPLLLEALEIPYTGANTSAILATSNKLTAKQRLRETGLPTADWVPNLDGHSEQNWDRDSRWIIKPIWEHASVGMDDDAVVEAEDETSLLQNLSQRERRFSRPCFAERFVNGREFNLSVLAGEVLPPAEIDFSTFPPDKPRIVGQRAKWEPESFEYQQTPRRFDFPASDQRLLKQLATLANECWDVFQLSGFARVDFRVDHAGEPWILEVNVNPCLSPDAGFAAALSEAGIPAHHAMDHILADAFRSVTKPLPTA